jgi:hypothetical protein
MPPSPYCLNREIGRLRTANRKLSVRPSEWYRQPPLWSLNWLTPDSKLQRQFGKVPLVLTTALLSSDARKTAPSERRFTLMWPEP